MSLTRGLNFPLLKPMNHADDITNFERPTFAIRLNKPWSENVNFGRAMNLPLP
jgi:hypothetical protein